MSLCINPERTEIRVAVNGGFVILIVKSATTEQERKLRKAQGTPELKRNKLNWRDDSDEVILEVMDDLLVDCSAMLESGEKTELTYNNDQGDEVPLNNNVEGWKSKISEKIKLSAGREFFAVNAEIGNEVIKN